MARLHQLRQAKIDVEVLDTVKAWEELAAVSRSYEERWVAEVGLGRARG
jgi:hypothetical protein